MAKKNKRVLSILLTLVMILGLLPTSVLAVDEQVPAEVVYEGGETISTDGLVTASKTIKHTGENNFEITLEVTTKDQVTTTPAEDAHVVLVIDRSNSMAGDRIKKARAAAEQFADIVLGEGAADGNQIAVVSYSWNYEDRIGLSGDLSQVKTAIGKVTTGDHEGNGGTNIQAGIHRAQEILAADTSDAKKVILVLSDGEPTYSYQATGTGSWDSCWKGLVGDHYWGFGSAKNVQFTGFNYNKVTGSGSSYWLDGGAAIDVTCRHGKSTTVSGEIFSNNGQPAIKEAEFAKDAGTEIYSVFLGESGKANAVNTMKGVASGEDHYKLASDVDDLAEIFKGIAGSITTPTDAGIVEDPMGQFIVLGDVSDLADQGVTRTSTGLEWNVAQAPYKENEDGSKTYTITYPITLNTSAEGFTDGGTYETNGTTTFRYKAGGADGSVTFAKPTVKGYTPTVPYTIEYYKWDTETEAYPEKPTDSNSGTAKMWGTVNALSNYANKYGENYYFVEGPISMVLSSKESNVLKLYYKPIPATVIVNHLVSTVTETDDGDVYSVPVPMGCDQYNKYKGDSFTNTKFLPSETYTKVDALTDENGTAYEPSDYTDLTLPAGTTEINIYYTQKGGDDRTPVDYVIQYWYRNNAWELVDGKYQLVEGKYFKGDVVDGTAKHGDTVKIADKNDGYTLDKIDGSTGEWELKLDKAEPNPDVVNVYYSKDPTTNPEEATLTIVHKYYLLGINGPELVDTYYEMGSEDAGETVYVGETYTAENCTRSGFTRMTSDAAMTKEMVSGSNEIVVEYYRDTREETHVSVYHYYRTWAWKVDPETGDGEYVLVKEDMKPGHPDGTFYVGQTYQAVPNPDGFQLNEEDSDDEARVLVQGENPFQLYYDAYESKEEDEADVTVHHIFETYRSYVDNNGNVVLDELDQDATIIELEETYYGVKGDTFVAQKRDKEGYEFYKADTADLKVTLQGEDGDYYIYYKTSVDDLGDKVPVKVQAVYKTYSRYINANGDDVTELVSKETSAPVELGQYYVGQKATALSSDYLKPGFSYDAKDLDNTENLTVTVTGEGDVIKVVYSRVADDRGTPVVLMVNNVYTTRTTYLENGEVKTSETSFTGQSTNYPIYVNQLIDLTNRGTKLPGYELDSTKTQPSGRYQVAGYEDDGKLFTFYWVMEVDRTTPATVKVVHHYKIHDTNPDVRDVEWTVGEDEAPVDAYAFQNYLLPYAYAGQFEFSNVTDVQHNGVSLSERESVELTTGDNRIDIYYVKNVDSRVPSSVKVIHNYYKDTESMAAGTTEASYEENIPAMEADKFTATLRLENGSLHYEFVSANPETYTVAVDDDPVNNVITINYVRAEATYTVVHEYYSNGNFRGSVTNTYSGKAGDTISADEIDKLTEYDGRNYTYRSADPETMVLAADGENVMTLRYTRTSGGGGGGGGSTDPAPDPDPGTDIEEPDVPTTELPEEPTDPAEPVEEPTEIEEPDVPMAEAPETGDSNFAYLHLLSLASAMGLAALFISDKRSKKHRDDT